MGKKLLTTLSLLVAFVVVVGLAIVILNRTLYYQPNQTFAAPTTLVSNEISQGADIIINIPKEVDKETAKADIKFKPEIPGDWNEGPKVDTLVFKPKEALDVGMHYEISIPAKEGALKQFFEIVDPPELVAVFPHSETETNEDSKITAVFNRPMIPLTTLGETEKNSIPVSLSPETDGRWKWISTRTLQFIPKEDLQRSSNYSVKILPEFTSFDGVILPETEHTFFTRPLRYERIDTGDLQYNQPIRISFNQPVDLAKTLNEINIRNKTADEDVNFIGEYDERNDEIDESVIALYQKKDKHGRDRLWDFTNEYEVNIKEAYPTEGDIILDEKNSSTLTATDIVKNITSISDRSPYATLEFFDPQGSIDIEFYEDVNLGSSKINADKLADIEYIKECKEEDPEEGEEIVVWTSYDSDDDDCEMVDNKSKIRLTFKENEIGISEKINLTLEKINNTDGKTISTDPIEYTLYSYPEFKIITAIQDGQEAASVEKLTVCSSTPLHTPELKTNEEDKEPESIDDYLTVNPEYRFKSWNTSSYTPPGQDPYGDCNAYEFQTDIYYNLTPETSYSITANLSDVFEQKAQHDISFTSGTLSKWLLDFWHLQDKYSVTTPNKTKLTFATENMMYMNMDICQVSAEGMLRVLNSGLESTSSASGQTSCEWETSETINIDGKYWTRNYFQVSLSDYVPENRGHYIVSFSHPGYTSYNGNIRYEHAKVTVTNLSAIEKEIQLFEYEDMSESERLSNTQKGELNNLYWITDIATMQPVSAANIDLYKKIDGENYDSIELSQSVQTGSDGVAEGPVIANPAGAIVKNGSDSAVIPRYSTELESASYASNAEKMYVYTDRPIYRPGDKVEIKGIYRTGYDSAFEINSAKDIPITIYDSNYEEVYTDELDVNEYGTFNTTFTIDASAPLGKFRINTGTQSATFEVEEYVGAAFKVEATTDKEEYIAGDTFNMDVQSDYYFGVPLEGGTLTYSVITQDYNFDRYTDEFFHFGDRWYFCWYDCSTDDTFILRGEMPINEQGTASISHELDFEKFFEEEEDRTSKIFVVNLTAENLNGQQISTQKSFIVHAGEKYLGIQTSSYFLEANQDFNLKVKSVDTEGTPVGQGNIEAQINQIGWKTIKRKEVDGNYYYRSEKELTLIDEFKLSTNGSGDWSKTLSVDNQGEYEISLRTTDGRGNVITTTRTIYVHSSSLPQYGEDSTVLVKPSNDTSLEIINETGMLNVGDTASFMIKNPFENKAKALIAVERGKVFNYEIVDIDQSFYNYEFEILEEHIPNMYASVVLLSDEPKLKFGSTNFFINIEEKELSVEVTPDKNHYLPGETVELDINVKDSSGEAVLTELSIAVVDMSVLALKGNPHKNPLKFFYSGFPLTVATSANLKNLLQEIEIKPGKGGGGGVDAQKKRGLFLDTAYWQAVLYTDESGNAKVSFELPDNLTTWQIESIGVSKDTKLGISYEEVIARKDLMLTPLKPRFIIPGDEFKLGAKVFNQTGENQSLKVSIASETLEVTGNAEQSMSLGKDETKTIYFEAKAPSDMQSGKHIFTMAAIGNDNEDTVEQTIKITRNNTYEATATANYTKEDAAYEFIFIPDNVVPDRGSLKINSSATLAVFISDGLNYLLRFPYGCTEQVASKLDALAIVKRGLNLENIGDKFEMEELVFDGETYTMDELIEIGLTRINENQNSDGGFRYFSGWESNFHLTLRMVTTLTNLQEAGIEVNNDSIVKAAQYLVLKINNDKAYDTNSNLIFTAHALSEMQSGSSLIADLAPRINERILSDTKLVQEDLDNMSLTYLAIVLTDNQDVFSYNDKETVYKALENRIRIDARGAYLPSGSSRHWAYYETDQKNTAMLLKALVADERDNTQLGNILRWLLNSRDKEGAWGSTASTLVVVDAFTDYLVWQKENESDFMLTISLDDEQLAEFDFNADTILNQKSVEVSPLNELEIGTLLPLAFEKENRNSAPNNFYYDIGLKYFLPVESIPPRDEGFSIERNFYSLEDEDLKNPLDSAHVGDILHGQIEIVVPETRNLVSIEDYLPAGVELINFDFATENQNVTGGDSYDDYDPYYGKGGYNYERGKFYPRVEELRDDRLFLFTNNISAGTYTYDYYVRVLIPGEYHHLPAVISEMYFPENFGRTEGDWFTVLE